MRVVRKTEKSTGSGTVEDIPFLHTGLSGMVEGQNDLVRNTVGVQKRPGGDGAYLRM